MSLPRIITQHFINGEFVDSVEPKTFDTFNPATGEVLAKVQEGQKADVDKAVAAARAAFEKVWRFTAPNARRDLMLKFASLIERDADDLARLETLNNGKPIGESLHVDLKLAVEVTRYYAGWADKVAGKQLPVDGDFVAWTRHEAVGVVGQIIPWNFPILMAIWKLAPALAMGCTVVLKSAEQTPLTALRLAALIKEAGFPNGVVNVLSGFGPTCGQHIVEHPDVNKIAFTGSTEVGKLIMAKAAPTLKRVTLELGGKSPLVICEDADLDKAVAAAMVGVFFNQGQVCTASSRVFVHEKIFDAFKAKLAEAMKSRKQGPGSDPANNIGPQVSAEQQKIVQGYIDSGIAEGARAVVGGGKHDGPGFFIQPTIFEGVRDDMKIVREEIFGPVMSLLKFATLDEAITRANNTAYGLAAAVMSSNVTTLMKFAAEVRAGTVWLNCNEVFKHCPFGGFKQSGIGRELGEYGLQAYTEVKTVILAVDCALPK